eukprot:CAMPEP_0170510440 /NCGR_PEP_ID=MMETSP0208-20121228/65770_1 /TAXON_ID=197538 /ORGANISM="Strombidium inclinatum, Strain S3" /LENGTH=261 /DNA_ID=CAMNT_0010793905 /DNA_START=940 /DNA_END=1725 /DNA_ORIENTATION=+
MTFTLGNEYKLHERHIYNLLDLLGDLGGVFEVIIGAIGFFVMPFSEISFILKGLQKLYLVKTEDSSLLLKPKPDSKQSNPAFLNTSLQSSLAKSSSGNPRQSKKILSIKSQVPESLRGTKVEEETKNHFPVIINDRSRNRVLLSHYFLTSWCFKKNKNPGLSVSKNERYDMLYKKGKKLLNEDLSIEKLIKSLRDIKIFMKKHWLDDRRRFEIQHNPRNIIDLDNLNDYLYDQPESDSELSVELEVCLGQQKCTPEEKYID